MQHLEKGKWLYNLWKPSENHRSTKYSSCNSKPMHLGRLCYMVSGQWQSAMLHGLAEVRLMTRALPYHRGQPPTALSPSDNGGPVALLSSWGRVKVLSRCHAPNRFGTVNMEDNVNIKWSWCEGWAWQSLIIAIYRTRRLSWCERWMPTLTVIYHTRTAKKQKKLKE